MKRNRLFVIGGALLTLALVARLALGLTYTASWLEELLEKNLKGDAEVGRVSLSLLAGTVTAHDLVLQTSGKDDWTLIKAQELELGVKLFPLLRRQLDVKRLILRKPEIAMRFNEEGEISLEDLFKSSSNDDDEPASDESSTLDADESEWLARLSETKVENGRVRILLEKEKLVVSIDDFGLNIDELRFNPERLDTLNEIKLQLAAKVRLLQEDGRELVRLDLNGPVWGKLFEERSGNFNADVQADLAIGEQSYLDPRVKIVQRIWNLVNKLEHIGINTKELPHQIHMARGQRLAGQYRQGEVRLRAPLGVAIGSFQLGIGRDSWIVTHDGQHEITVELLAGKSISSVVGSLVDRLPGKLKEEAGERFFEEGGFLLKVVSRGDLKDPQVDYLSQLPGGKSTLDKLEKKAGGFLRDLLEKQ